jgi:ankyrin repeat protein
LHKRLLKEHFAKTAEDARSVTESQSAASRVGDYTSDNGENLSVEFSTDKEIIRSKPYARQNKRLLKAYFRDRGLQFGTISENVKAQKSDRNVEESTALTPHRHQPRPPSPRASHGRQHASEISHTWKLFQEETRKKADKLCSAARNGDLIQVRSLIEDLGAFIDAHGEKGDTPLLCATEFGRARIVHYLLRKGASVHLSSHIESGEDSADSKQLQEVYSPIHLAVKVGAVDIVDLLITSKANVNDARCEMVKYNDQGDSVIVKDTTPLHLTTYDPECKVADQLLQHCASLSVQDSDGYTPLMLAVEKSNTHAVRIFLEAGAPLDPGDVDVVSPFETACNKLSENSQECLEVFILLIKHGADIKKRWSGHSPMVRLCLQSPLSERHKEALHLLFQAGAHLRVLEPLADESEKPRYVTPLACLMPSRLFWSNGEGKRELAIRVKIVTIFITNGVVKGCSHGFVALSRLMYGFFNYCEDMQRWFPFVLDFAILLVKAGAKFSDACPYLAKQKHFEEKSRRSLVGKRILCALHIVAEHTDKSYKHPGDFMAETRAEFSQWVADGCRRRKWPWAMIPFETEQHFKTHRTGGLTGLWVRSLG